MGLLDKCLQYFEKVLPNKEEERKGEEELSSEDGCPSSNAIKEQQQQSRRNSRRQTVGGGSVAEETQRVLRANDREFNMQFGYADNFIKTSKYNLLTFVPCNLYEQFQRLANFYFLVLMILQFIPQISSVAWYSTAVPLSIVLLISAIKEGYDDIQRHKSDNQVNNRISYVVRNGRLEEERWMNVKVGDVVRMENEHSIAADLLLLSSSEPHGLCYVETAELDGETNLKARSALTETSAMGDVVREISAFDGEIHCEAPNNRLERFEGRLSFGGRDLPLENGRMLLRGCRLKNTRWCYGVVVFAGKDTKLMMNSGKALLKRTSLDRFLNILIMGIVLFLIAMCFICTMLSFVWEVVTGRDFTAYLEWDSVVPRHGPDDRGIRQMLYISFLQFFSYIILLNTVVPISLYISVEVIRFIHSQWINFDEKMYYAKTDTPARARTTTLNEELGQVQYIFSDKTGTLTQNIMIFKKCSINGRYYGDVLSARGEPLPIPDSDDPHHEAGPNCPPHLDFSTNRWHEPAFRFYDPALVEDTRRVGEVKEFWRLLAICHTVMPERKSGNVLEYRAQSPDEAALTSAARNFGYVFKSRTPHSVTIEVDGREEIYEVLHILDFDNVRKRMSVLVRGRSGRVKLYCKGADSMVLARCSSTANSELLKSATLQHLDKFAADGLRTLCVAYKYIEDAAYFADWVERLHRVQVEMSPDKDSRLDELYEELEKDLLLLGATAIEDKLQQGVPETIATLAQANIKIWVLTGDKTETAINIGYSSRLLTDEMREVFVIDGKEEREVEVQLKDIKRRIERSCDGNPQGCTISRSLFHAPLDAHNSAYSGPSATVLDYIQQQIHLVEELEREKALENERSPVAARRRGSLFADLYRGSSSDGKNSGDGSSSCEDLDRETIIADTETKEPMNASSFYPTPRSSRPPSPSPPLHQHHNGGSGADLTTSTTANSAPNRLDVAQASTKIDNAGANDPQNQHHQRRPTLPPPPPPSPPRFSAPIHPQQQQQEEGEDESEDNNTNDVVVVVPMPKALLETQRQFLSRGLASAPGGLEELEGKGSGGEVSGMEKGVDVGIVINKGDGEEEEGGRDRDDGGGGFALVINGDSLAHALKRRYEKLFLDISCACLAVICCRVTPLQKAQVVDLVKRNVKAVTLAIGDGANDVSMIRTAHIGVGISGQEGMQAVLSSDFSIGQFRYLERLLLVHGRWSYLRMSKFLRYFFYKNFSYTLTNFWYSFFCGYSAQTIYDPLLIATYNMFYTSLPVLAMGIFDQDVDDDYSLRYPKLYIPGQYNLFFNMRIFVYSIIHGMISSLVLFFIPFGALFQATDPQGRDNNDYPLLAFTVFTALVVVVTGQIAFDTAYWTVFNHIVVWGSLAFYVAVVVVAYQVVPYTYTIHIAPTDISYGIAFRAFTSLEFWLSILLICVCLLLPVMINRFFWLDTHPSYADRLRELAKRQASSPSKPAGAGKGPEEGGIGGRPMARSAPVRRSRRGSAAAGLLKSGYAFSHSPGFGELIAKGTLFRNLNLAAEHFRIPSLRRNGGGGGSGENSETTLKNPTRMSSQDRQRDRSPSPMLQRLPQATRNVIAASAQYLLPTPLPRPSTAATSASLPSLLDARELEATRRNDAVKREGDHWGAIAGSGGDYQQGSSPTTMMVEGSPTSAIRDDDDEVSLPTLPSTSRMGSRPNNAKSSKQRKQEASRSATSPSADTEEISAVGGGESPTHTSTGFSQSSLTAYSMPITPTSTTTLGERRPSTMLTSNDDDEAELKEIPYHHHHSIVVNADDGYPLPSGEEWVETAAANADPTSGDDDLSRIRRGGRGKGKKEMEEEEEAATKNNRPYHANIQHSHAPSIAFTAKNHTTIRPSHRTTITSGKAAANSTKERRRSSSSSVSGNEVKKANGGVGERIRASNYSTSTSTPSTSATRAWMGEATGTSGSEYSKKRGVSTGGVTSVPSSSSAAGSFVGKRKTSRRPSGRGKERIKSGTSRGGDDGDDDNHESAYITDV